MTVQQPATAGFAVAINDWRDQVQVGRDRRRQRLQQRQTAHGEGEG
jgi:hypothetical protein